MSHINNKMSRQYILKHNKSSQERLNLQHELYKDSSQKLLIRAGLTRGTNILEVGCGTGLMTTWIAEQVGESGRVVSFDIDKNYVAITQLKCSKYSNVKIIQMDVLQPDDDNKEFEKPFDIIYFRLVLHHLYYTPIGY